MNNIIENPRVSMFDVGDLVTFTCYDNVHTCIVDTFDVSNDFISFNDGWFRFSLDGFLDGYYMHHGRPGSKQAQKQGY